MFFLHLASLKHQIMGRLNIYLSQLHHLQLTKHLVKIHKGSLEHFKINFQNKPPLLKRQIFYIKTRLYGCWSVAKMEIFVHLYLCYMKFYFDYIFHIYVIYFITYLLYIYIYITCFLILSHISISMLFDFKSIDNNFIFNICTKLL